VTEEVSCDPTSGLLVQLYEGELGGAIDAHNQVQAPFLGPDLGTVDVEGAERIALELASLGLAAVDLGQAGDVVALEATM
jgi:hypothetical protein